MLALLLLLIVGVVDAANPTVAPTPFFATLPTAEPTLAPTNPTPNPTSLPTLLPNTVVTPAPSGFSAKKSIPVIYLTDKTSFNHHNWCPTMAKVMSKQVSLINSLKGQLVTFGVEQSGQADFAYFTFNTTSGYPNGGYFYDLINQLSSAGGFSVEYRQAPLKSDSQTNQQYALAVTPAVDVHAGRWLSDTASNRLAGLDFTTQLNDASQILVSPSGPALADNTWGFAQPFTNQLWGIIVCFLAVHSLFGAMFKDRSERAQDYIYWHFGKFAGATDPDGEKQIHMQLLDLAFCFVIFILMASYTANLATFLIATVTIVPTVTSLDQANAASMKICVLNGAATATTLTNYYPDIIQVPQPAYAALGLATGQCVAAFMTMADYTIMLSRQALDAKCNFVMVGAVVQEFRGAWPLTRDYGEKGYCTSFLNQVFTALLLNLKSTGYFDTDFQHNVDIQTDIVCPANPINKISLGPDNVKGIFYLYGFCFALCVALFYLQYLATPELNKMYDKYNMAKYLGKTMIWLDPTSEAEKEEKLLLRQEEEEAAAAENLELVELSIQGGSGGDEDSRLSADVAESASAADEVRRPNKPNAKKKKAKAPPPFPLNAPGLADVVSFFNPFSLIPSSGAGEGQQQQQRQPHQSGPPGPGRPVPWPEESPEERVGGEQRGRAEGGGGLASTSRDRLLA